MLDQLVAQSTLAFEGKITKLGATSIPTIPTTPHTAVVEVVNVLAESKSSPIRKGESVTVLVKDLSGLQPGTVAVFFANGWVQGEGIAVIESGRVASYDLARLRGQVDTALQRKRLRPIQENLSAADLVIVGKVVQVRRPELPSPPADALRTPSEHEPKLREAVVEVETVLKGETGADRETVLFPSSHDVAWYHLPKFETGQEGIWILKTDARLERYVVKKPHDFLSRARLQDVRSILETQQ